ncbi:MBL fold metallo-hydrolase [Thalassobacterium sedimentorum]|uniref:MBL fold metallo-hydrolase n=1 Tax=Thalassobacterium sedimentorum TaxID=3041258 RepID=UPI00281156A4|nr:MBL fold metallo-hydrolase [Coraliomargarita sp. SDUM461004]
MAQVRHCDNLVTAQYLRIETGAVACIVSRIMIIEFQELPPIGTNAFALIEPSLQQCVIIDAPADAYAWAQQVADKHGCKIVALILTHGHWDHILDGHQFAAAGVPTYGHADDREMFAAPSKMASYAIPGLELKEVPIDHWIQGGDQLELLGTQMEIRHVPGHCPGNVLVYIASEKAAIVGDVIFAGSVGRYDLPGGDFSVLEKSIKTQVYTLPDETTLYPGHGPATSVIQEKASNPYVKG